jgi:hypothetical protein
MSDETMGFFKWPNTSSGAVALVSTKYVTEMSAWNLLDGKGRPVRKSDNLTSIYELII